MLLNDEHTLGRIWIFSYWIWILSRWILSCQSFLGGINHPVIWLDVHCPKEKLTKNSHSRVIMKRNDTRWWQAKYSHLRIVGITSEHKQWLTEFANPIAMPQRKNLTENLSHSNRCKYVIAGVRLAVVIRKYGNSGVRPTSTGLIASVSQQTMNMNHIE